MSRRNNKNYDQPIPIDESAIQSVKGEVIRCSALNIRERPCGDSPVLEVVKAGEPLLINLSAKYDHFYEVSTQSGVKGYANKLYVSLSE